MELRRTRRRAEGSVSMRNLTPDLDHMRGRNAELETEVVTSLTGMGLGMPSDPRLCLLPGLISTPPVKYLKRVCKWSGGHL